MPALSAAFFDQIYAPATTNGSFESFFLNTCRPSTRELRPSKPHDKQPATHPLVIFSPGGGNSRLIYNAIAQSISSYGYHVLTIDHPYDALGVEYPDGSYVLAANYTTDADYETAIHVRTADVHFVLDSLSSKSQRLAALLPRSSAALSQVAVIGHSLGGATALSAMLADERISAGANFDGKFFPGVLPPRGSDKDKLDRPFMLVGNEARNASTDPTWDLVWQEYLAGPRVELQVQGWQHGAFTDFPLLMSSVGAKGYLDGIGDVNGPRGIEVITKSLLAFLESARKPAGKADMDKVLAKFPEVGVVAVEGY